MRVATVINAKGGCGKSTIAISVAAAAARRNRKTLLLDLDPQAQLTQWLGAGDGLTPDGTIVEVFRGTQSLSLLVQSTRTPNLSFVPSADGLEEVGRHISEVEGYQEILGSQLAKISRRWDLVVIDSPNQISPVMENAIWPADVFVVPFESTKAVRSYANFFKLVLGLRPEEDYRIMHVLTNLSRFPSLRRRVLGLMAQDGLAPARTEVRSCAWLAQVDEAGGSIFDFRPHSKGAEDTEKLMEEITE